MELIGRINGTGRVLVRSTLHLVVVIVDEALWIHQFPQFRGGILVECQMHWLIRVTGHTGVLTTNNYL